MTPDSTQFILKCFDRFLLQWRDEYYLNEIRIDKKWSDITIEIRRWRKERVNGLSRSGTHEIIFKQTINVESGEKFVFYISHILQQYGCPKEIFQKFLDEENINIKI